MRKSTQDKGTRYQATVPDTLDLAERAALAVNALTGSADERFFHESCQCSHLDHRTPYMNWVWNGPCMQKPLHALPLLRAMSGSTQNADIDEKMLEAITRDIDEDGLWWLKVKDRPWRQDTFKEDQVWPCTQGRLIVALLDRYRVDPDRRWVELAGRLAKGLVGIALRNDDRAWYHTAYKRGGWQGDTSPSAQLIGAYDVQSTRKEPEREAPYNIGLPLRGLSRWYAISGDKAALELADSLARFHLKPAMWGSIGPEMLVGAEHAHWQGHFHSCTMGMMGMLEYARVRGDARIMRFVRDFYEYARCFGIARMGFFPAVLRPVAPAGWQKDGLYLAADVEVPPQDTFADWQDLDFIFLPDTFHSAARPDQVDLTINMVSFQEMTTQQVEGYVRRAFEFECPYLYSLNRDRSHHNDELSNVRSIIGQHYWPHQIDLLPVSYTKMLHEDPDGEDSGYKHVVGWRRVPGAETAR